MRRLKNILAILLAAIMVIGVVPLSALADAGTADNTITFTGVSEYDADGWAVWQLSNEIKVRLTVASQAEYGGEYDFQQINTENNTFVLSDKSVDMYYLVVDYMGTDPDIIYGKYNDKNLSMESPADGTDYNYINLPQGDGSDYFENGKMTFGFVLNDNARKDVEITPDPKQFDDFFCETENGVVSFRSVYTDWVIATARVIVDGKALTEVDENGRFKLMPDTEYTIEITTAEGVTANLVRDKACQLVDGKFTTVLDDNSYYTLSLEYNSSGDLSMPDKNPITDPANMFLSFSEEEEIKNIYSVLGKSDNIKGISYDEKTNTLTLNNFANDKAELFLHRMGLGLKINVIGTNRLSNIVVDCSGFDGSYPTGIEFIGNGTIHINRNNDEFDGIMIYADETDSFVKFGKDVKALIKGGKYNKPIGIYNRASEKDGIIFDYNTNLSKDILVSPTKRIEEIKVYNAETIRKDYTLGANLLMLKVSDTAEHAYPLPDNAKLAAYRSYSGESLFRVCVLRYTKDYGYILSPYSDQDNEYYYFDPTDDSGDLVLADKQEVSGDPITLPEDNFTSTISVINSLESSLSYAYKYTDSKTGELFAVDDSYDYDEAKDQTIITRYVLRLDEVPEFKNPIGSVYEKFTSTNGYPDLPDNYAAVEKAPVYSFNYKNQTLKTDNLCPKGHNEKVTYYKKATFGKDGKIEKTCNDCLEKTYSKTIKAIKTVSFSKSSLTYNGKDQSMPKLVVKDSKGKTISSKYYTVSGKKKGKSVGAYKITVTFKGDYSGKKVLTYYINPKPVKITSVKSTKKGYLNVSWTTQKKEISGYQVQYADNSKFKKAKTVSVSYKSKSVLIKKLKSKKIYRVRVSTFKKVGGKKYYSSWSTVKSAKTK